VPTSRRVGTALRVFADPTLAKAAQAARRPAPKVVVDAKLL